ncbi:hypothetical protein D9757_007088 [Collybiopsis confluens]|uniref:Beta-glucuronidase C-terminal domain-containing protein n=1 Tax=Collybiopsis confluens TaxID=2823264 RepID=A0A8H5M4C4_9AGAR|nr:hypothetical protein D9757_007088 [Collybiopsis confluens]
MLRMARKCHQVLAVLEEPIIQGFLVLGRFSWYKSLISLGRIIAARTMLLSNLFSSFFFSAAAAQVATLNVAIPSTAPSSASAISPDQLSFSIEQDRWTDWAGATTRNQFLFNVLENLATLAGEPPRIRIGADSEDHTDFQPGLQVVEETFAAPSPATPYPEASHIIVGDAFYRAAQNLPSGTHVTWGVNFKSDNITAAFLEARAIAQAFSSFPSSSGLVLDAVEIGNEADLYVNDGNRPSNFTIAVYVPQWASFATNVSATVPISPSTSIKFWGGAFAGSSHTTTGFSPQGLFANGILSTTPGKQINTISQHLYSGSGQGCTTAITTCIQNLMSKANVRGNLSTLIPDIAATKAQGLTYVLGETNSYFGHGAPNVSHSAGSALWALDYTFFATELGIQRVYFHEGVGYKYNFIQPVTLNVSITDGTPLANPLPPHVQPAYYGAIVAAEAVGNGGSRIAEISVGSATVSGHAIFTSNGQLSKAVFINSQGFFTGTTTSRPSTHLNLSFSGKAPSSMTVKRLVIGHADDTSGLTWGGQTYETTDGKVGGTLSVTTSSVSAGIDIPASQAVLVTFTS